MSESKAMTHGELDAIRMRHRHRNAGNSSMLAFFVCTPADIGTLLAENGRLRKEAKAGRRRLEKRIAKNCGCESCPDETGLRASPNMKAECGRLLKCERDAAVAEVRELSISNSIQCTHCLHSELSILSKPRCDCTGKNKLFFFGNGAGYRRRRNEGN